ncbi:hypothetical protein ACA910_001210 [Epithemia clementina (nom. ined.)]
MDRTQAAKMSMVLDNKNKNNYNYSNSSFHWNNTSTAPSAMSGGHPLVLTSPYIAGGGNGTTMPDNHSSTTNTSSQSLSSNTSARINSGCFTRLSDAPRNISCSRNRNHVPFHSRNKTNNKTSVVGSLGRRGGAWAIDAYSSTQERSNRCSRNAKYRTFPQTTQNKMLLGGPGDASFRRAYRPRHHARPSQTASYVNVRPAISSTTNDGGASAAVPAETRWGSTTPYNINSGTNKGQLHLNNNLQRQGQEQEQQLGLNGSAYSGSCPTSSSNSKNGWFANSTTSSQQYYDPHHRGNSWWQPQQPQHFQYYGYYTGATNDDFSSSGSKERNPPSSSTVGNPPTSPPLTTTNQSERTGKVTQLLRRELKVTLLREELKQTLAMYQTSFMMDGTSQLEYDPEQPFYGYDSDDNEVLVDELLFDDKEHTREGVLAYNPFRSSYFP